MHPRHREKMQVCEKIGKAREAVTWYEMIDRFDQCSYIKLLPKTGRTHQLRVHMAWLGYPMLADGLYGGRSEVYAHDLLESADPTPATATDPAAGPARTSPQISASGQW